MNIRDKLDPGIYVIIRPGAIKLTRTMQEREHTLVELARMEKVRRFLIDNGICDMDSFKDYLTENNLEWIEMKSKEEIISKLSEHHSSTPSKWRKKTEWRMAKQVLASLFATNCHNDA